MKKVFFFHFSALLSVVSFAQNDATPSKATGLPENFIIEKSIPVTSVKNQAITGTCWCFSTTSLVESQCMKKSLGQMDISEMFSVRNIYIEKAQNYILRQGHTQFGEGGLGHDLIRAIATYGAMPESEYSGLKGEKQHNHSKLVSNLQEYLDNILKKKPVPLNWMDGYVAILDQTLGRPPGDFMYQGKRYTPKSFATEVLQFDASEYVNITSFTDHLYYSPFVINVPDNFSNGQYYNLPLNEMIQVTKDAIRNGYSVLWDADVSNDGFMQKLGIAFHNDTAANTIAPIRSLRAIKAEAMKGKAVNNTQPSDAEMQAKANRQNTDSIGRVRGTNTAMSTPKEIKQEAKWNADIRQALFENLTTQDDHLMHITGIERAENGSTYFLVKNSWGDIGPVHGYINVSEAYFAINTISLIIPKAALSKELLAKLGVK